MKRTAAPEALARLFSAIVKEAETNEAFARRLGEALAGIAPEKIDKPKTRSRRSFDPSQFHATNILRLHGERVLRGKLEQVKALEDLKAVAKASGLVLPESASKAKASRTDLIEGIVAAAKHYDAQRNAAST
ncbi:MAG: hypothetical protein F9K29_05205 [Hyphomicrobiaceae bacterium]|nr:MAG: hypothetical protein F9K29_05205 [Hyphomicrobiaceae bacterium]